MCRPYSVLLPVGFAVPLLLPATRCALTAPFRPCRAETRWFIFCGTFPQVTLAGHYPAPFLAGARTFLPHAVTRIPAVAQPSGALALAVINALWQGRAQDQRSDIREFRWRNGGASNYAVDHQYPVSGLGGEHQLGEYLGVAQIPHRVEISPGLGIGIANREHLIIPARIGLNLLRLIFTPKHLPNAVGFLIDLECLHTCR
jgi:hypothetical protein